MTPPRRPVTRRMTELAKLSQTKHNNNALFDSDDVICLDDDKEPQIATKFDSEEIICFNENDTQIAKKKLKEIYIGPDEVIVLDDDEEATVEGTTKKLNNLELGTTKNSSISKGKRVNRSKGEESTAANNKKKLVCETCKRSDQTHSTYMSDGLLMHRRNCEECIKKAEERERLLKHLDQYSAQIGHSFVDSESDEADEPTFNASKSSFNPYAGGDNENEEDKENQKPEEPLLLDEETKKSIAAIDEMIQDLKREASLLSKVKELNKKIQQKDEEINKCQKEMLEKIEKAMEKLTCTRNE